MSEIKHATIKTAKAEVHGKHPLRDSGNHDKLLRYVQDRLLIGKEVRDSRISRYAQIDKDVAGWLRLSEEDKKRQEEHQKNGTPQAIATNLPLNFVHLDDMMTYYAQTFSPNRGMFYHTGKPGEVDAANQIVTLMNNHAIYGAFYRQTLLSIFSILKYNLGGFHTYWSKDFGPKLQRNPQTQLDEVTDVVVWAGNKLDALDMYNTFWDPTVHPVNLYKDGEWAARTFIRSHYWLKNKCSKAMYFNCDEELENDGGISDCTYYRHPPSEANLSADESTSATNWVSVLREVPGYATSTGFEMTEVYIKINPNDFGLIPGNTTDRARRDRYEIWRITILNDRKVIECTYMNNVHGFLPFFFGLSNDDVMGEAAKSTAEIIQPLQNFASFLLNAHIAGNRKNLYGTTFYDPSMVEYDKVPAGEVAARVPLKASAYGRDIRTMVFHDNNTLDTKQTMSDLKDVLAVIDQFFPTQSLPSQIAGIDRAVDSQVAAVQQGANRRQHKGARLLDDSLMRPMRFSMYYNIVQYQDDGVEVTDFYGGTTTIDLEKLRATDLPYIIGQGLKAIDRQAAVSALQQVIFALIQNQVAAAQTDIMGLIDYWTSMMDIDVDMNQFRLPPPQAAAASAQVAPGAEGGAAAPDVGVTPMTNPQAVTAPIYG